MDKTTHNILNRFCWKKRSHRIGYKPAMLEPDYAKKTYGTPYVMGGFAVGTDGVIMCAFHAHGEPDTNDGARKPVVDILRGLDPALCTIPLDTSLRKRFVGHWEVAAVHKKYVLSWCHYAALCSLRGVRMSPPRYVGAPIYFLHSGGWGAVMGIFNGESKSTRLRNIKSTAQPPEDEY